MAQALPQGFDDIIEELESNASNHLPDMSHTMEPIIIRGNGNITLFGLSNGFTNSFPSSLLGRVSREEFESTISRINSLLRAQHSTNAKLLILGCLCCCCSLGCSLLWPTLALSKRTKKFTRKVVIPRKLQIVSQTGLKLEISETEMSYEPLIHGICSGHRIHA